MTTAIERQVHLTAHQRAELLPVERPAEPLGPQEIEGRTLASLISPGTELACYAMDPPRWVGVGYAAVFEAEAVGTDVKDIEVGDRLFCQGPHRSFQRAARDHVVPVPDELSAPVACFARMLAISMATLSTTATHPPATVLVTGLGMVGYLASALFRACGYRVVACDVDPARREFAKAQGIDDVREAVPLDDEQLCGHISLVVECSGHEQAVIDACKIVRRGGEVSMVGVPWVRRCDAPAFDVLHAVFHQYVILRSGWEHQLPMNDTPFHANCTMDNFAGAMRWLAEKRVDVSPLYDMVAPADAPQVYRDLHARKTSKLTAAFDWSNAR